MTPEQILEFAKFAFIEGVGRFSGVPTEHEVLEAWRASQTRQALVLGLTKAKAPEGG